MNATSMTNVLPPARENSLPDGWKRTFPDDSERNPPPSKYTAPSSPGSERDAKRRFIVLVAEDNSTDVLLLKEAIEIHCLPIELHVVDDGEKALSFIFKPEHDAAAPFPDIVIIDLNLPRRSGLEVLRRVRKSKLGEKLPVVVFTSSDSVDDRERVAALGVTRYFRKPADYEKFLEIGEILRAVCAELRSDH
jgi:CheY-like chemotaxis protein